MKRSGANNPSCGHCRHLEQHDFSRERGLVPMDSVTDYMCGHPQVAGLERSKRWCGFSPRRIDACPQEEAND